MSLATHAVRQAAGPSSGTLALAGLGVFCLANPEKALQLLQRLLLTLAEVQGTAGHGGAGLSHSHAAPTPIVIHAGSGGHSNAGSGGGPLGGIYALALQLSVGAGLCWGSYALLVNVLPEQAKNMLPVTQGTFKTAVTSLGKGLMSVKDSLSQEIANLLNLTTDLQAKQDDTHEQVLYVQDQVADVHDDLGRMDARLADCNDRLAKQDKRTTYIARGIRLVTAGMSSLLPDDDELIQELKTFSKNSEGASANLLAPRTKANSGIHCTDDAPPTPDAHRAAVRARRSDHHSTGGSSSRRSSSSRRGRSSSSRSGRRAASADLPSGNHHLNISNNSNNHKTSTMDFPSEDTLSVSTGTPIRHVMIPRKSKTTSSQASCTGASLVAQPECKELEEVRALLVRMDDSARRSIPMM